MCVRGDKTPCRSPAFFLFLCLYLYLFSRTHIPVHRSSCGTTFFVLCSPCAHFSAFFRMECLCGIVIVTCVLPKLICVGGFSPWIPHTHTRIPLWYKYTHSKDLDSHHLIPTQTELTRTLNHTTRTHTLWLSQINSIWFVTIFYITIAVAAAAAAATALRTHFSAATVFTASFWMALCTLSVRSF